MALYKEFTQDDGVVTSYHRILSMSHHVNSHIEIAVVSYVNAESRAKDIVCPNRPYRVCVTYGAPYQENMTIQEAYNYIKTLPEFEGATDV